VNVLSPSEISTLDSELKLIHGDTTPATTLESIMDRLTQSNNLENILDVEMNKLRLMPGYRTLQNPTSFEKRFFSYFSQNILDHANTELDIVKNEIFQDRRGEFESLVNRSRKVAMEHVLSLDPTIPADLERLHQIFVTNRRYFQRTGNIGTLQSEVIDSSHAELRQ
jgi:hypothetical protein